MNAMIEALQSKATQLEAITNNARVQAEHNNCAVIINNPLETVDKLNNLSAFHGFNALSSICNSLGWYVINALVWEWRVANKTVIKSKFDIFDNDAPVPTLDDMAEARNEAAAERAAEQNVIDNGFGVLPKVDGIKFAAAYKGMLKSLQGYTEYDLSRLPMPNGIFNQMMEGVDGRRVDEAAAKFTERLIAHHASKADIEKSMQRRLTAAPPRDIARETKQLDHVMLSLQRVVREPLSDATWGMLPLWAQYKISHNVRQQVIQALTLELSRKNISDRKNEIELLDLLEEVDLELRSAASNAEIKLAFELGKLDPTKHTIQ